MAEPPSQSAPSMGYKPALDGVRAIAVVSVLLFHGGVGALEGGFLGVDLFFVLSGYLITTLLVLEADRTGSIDLRAFYRRRMRRLMPALLVAVVGVAAYAIAVEPSSWSTLREDGLASLLYVPNWHFILSQQSYFDQFASPSPLRHMWSLGIEEQWYLIWPAVVLVALRWTRRRPRWVLASAAALAAAASAWWMAALSSADADPSRTYYGTDTRAQALLIGAALAFALPALAGRLRSWTAPAVGGLALAGIIGMMAVTSEATTWLYEGGFAAVATLAAALIASVVVAERSLLARLIGARPLAAVGRVSYGLYLFHWPIFVALTPARTGVAGLPLLGVRVATTVAVTLLSYHAVEQPIRLGRGRGASRRPAAPIAWKCGVAMAGLAAVFVLPAAVVAPPPAQQLASAASGPAPVHGATARATDADPLDVLVVGDSVAAKLADEFPAAGHPAVAVEKFALLGCGVTPGRAVINGRVIPLKEGCDEWAEWWAAGARGEADVAVVVIGAWEVADQKVGDAVLRAGTPAATARLTSKVLEGIDRLGARPVVVLNVPCFREESRELGAGGSPRNDAWRVDWINRVLDSAVAQRTNASTVDLRSFLCPEGEPREARGGGALRYDGVHFTPQGAAEVWDWLVPQLRDVSTASRHRDGRGAA